MDLQGSEYSSFTFFIFRSIIIFISPPLSMINLLSSCIFLAAVWGGAKLADVLELVGIPKLTSATPSGGKHVEFVSIDKCKVLKFLV